MYPIVRHEFLWADKPEHPLMVDDESYEVVRTTVKRIATSGGEVAGDVLLFTHYVRRP